MQSLALVLCGLVGMTEVRAPTDYCPAAMNVTARADRVIRHNERIHLSAPWVVSFTTDSHYVDPHRTDGVALRAYTICNRHAIFVSMRHPGSILHEYMHAVDCEAGEWDTSRLHWGWRAKGRHIVEQQFNPEGITWKEGGI